MNDLRITWKTTKPVTEKDRDLTSRASKQGREAISIQSSWRYASPFADPKAIIILVGQSIVGLPFPTISTRWSVLDRFSGKV